MPTTLAYVAVRLRVTVAREKRTQPVKTVFGTTKTTKPCRYGPIMNGPTRSGSSQGIRLPVITPRITGTKAATATASAPAKRPSR